MKVIPVIDLKGGDVVRARGGARHLYAPISTPLAATCRPQDVVGGFLALHPFDTIYIADLDAITGAGDQVRAITQLEAEFPDLAFWVDCGLRTENAVARWCERHRSAPIIGSESLDSLADAPHLKGKKRRILSLDFRGDEFLGPPELAEDPSRWPQRVIAMSLAKVGAASGPDFARLARLRALAPGCEFYAAGGLRHAGDLRRLAAAGAAGVLVASALHDGAITASDLTIDQACP